MAGSFMRRRSCFRHRPALPECHCGHRPERAGHDRSAGPAPAKKAAILRLSSTVCARAEAPKKAVGAIAASIPTAACHMIAEGAFYQVLGAGHFKTRAKPNQIEQLAAKIQSRRLQCRDQAPARMNLAASFSRTRQAEPRGRGRWPSLCRLAVEVLGGCVGLGLGRSF